jgi:hypothetical protein
VYSAKWTILEKWCKSRKLNPLSLCTADLADFFIYLFNVRKLAPITIKGYRSAIARVCRLRGLRNPGQDPHLSNLVNNFSLERPRNVQLFPKWSIDVVLMYISKTPFEPLDSATLENLTLKTVFLVTLALAGRVSEIHALSARKDCMRFNQDESVSLLSFPGFLAKNALPERGNQQYVLRPLPESLLCPVRALKVYLKRTERQRTDNAPLFLPVVGSSKASPQLISSWIRSLIVQAYKAAANINNVREVAGNITWPLAGCTPRMGPGKSRASGSSHPHVTTLTNNAAMEKRTVRGNPGSWAADHTDQGPRNLSGTPAAEMGATQVPDLSRPAHELRAIAASLAFFRGAALRDITLAVGWSSQSTFGRFYLRHMPDQRADGTQGPPVQLPALLEDPSIPL